MSKKLIYTRSFTVEDYLEYRMSANCETLREELIDRASHGEIPKEAEGIWWGEVTPIKDKGTIEVSLYYEEGEEKTPTPSEAEEKNYTCENCGAALTEDEKIKMSDEKTILCSQCLWTGQGGL